MDYYTKIPNNHLEYFVFGLKRGGNHAIINWILGHYNSYIYYNNCHADLNENSLYTDSREIYKKGTEPYEIKILSFEDKPAGIEEKKPSEIKKICNFNSKKNILILRDAYNTYASRYMKKQNPSSGMFSWNENWENYNDPKIWIEYAKEYIGQNNYLNNSIKINYNSWFKSKKYREQLSKMINKNHSDDNLQEILNIGGGSSFDNLNFDKKAQEMKVLERWKKLKYNKNYIQKILMNQEVKELNNKIFNFSISPIKLI